MNSLDRYLREHGDQEVVEEREPLAEKNPRLEKLVDAYEVWLAAFNGRVLGVLYIHTLDTIADLEYTASDVCDLSLRLTEYEGHKSFSCSGLFLSALVNTGDDESYEVVTEHLDTRLHWLGYRNVKELTVIGDAGDWAGYLMSGGSLVINGDAGHLAGDNMSGGSLTINGDAGKGAGRRMSGGVLRVEGKIFSIEDSWEGGEIYERGKLVRFSSESEPWYVRLKSFINIFGENHDA